MISDTGIEQIESSFDSSAYGPSDLVIITIDGHDVTVPIDYTNAVIDPTIDELADRNPFVCPGCREIIEINREIIVDRIDDLTIKHSQCGTIAFDSHSDDHNSAE